MDAERVARVHVVHHVREVAKMAAQIIVQMAATPIASLIVINGHGSQFLWYREPERFPILLWIVKRICTII